MKRLIGVLLVAMATIACIGGVNAARFYPQVRDAESGTGNTIAIAYYRYGVVPDMIVYDLWDFGLQASTAEVMGEFLRFSGEMKDRRFREVHLAYHGRTKFVLDGDDFHEMGRDLAWQNPVYTLRTFPEKLRHPDGRPAFERWSGGMLGVLNAQVEDMNKMGRQWFIGDLLEQ